MERPSFWPFRDNSAGLSPEQQTSMVQYGKANKGQTKVRTFFEKKMNMVFFWTLEKYFEIFVSDLWPLMILWQPHWGNPQLFIQKFLGI